VIAPPEGVFAMTITFQAPFSGQAPLPFRYLVPVSRFTHCYTWFSGANSKQAAAHSNSILVVLTWAEFIGQGTFA
jgi:hypothetical protein